jgi:hypothetical protein
MGLEELPHHCFPSRRTVMPPYILCTVARYEQPRAVKNKPIQGLCYLQYVHGDLERHGWASNTLTRVSYVSLCLDTEAVSSIRSDGHPSPWVALFFTYLPSSASKIFIAFIVFFPLRTGSPFFS